MCAMRGKQNQTGFTIVEVLIVIAISAVLASTIVAWQGKFIENARFTEAMDNIHSQLNKARREVYSVVNENPGMDCHGNSGTAGTNTGCVTFGKAVVFTQGSSQATVKTLVARVSGDDFTDLEVRYLREIGSLERTIDLKWGVEFIRGRRDGATVNTVVFARDFRTGDLQTYVMYSTNVTNWNSYTTGRRSEAVFRFESPEGSVGRIHVNETPDSLRRSYE